MESTFKLRPEIGLMVLTKYREYLKSTDAQDDDLYIKCLALLETLDAEKLQAILESVYDSSMKREEGRHHHFSVVLTPSLSNFGEEIKDCPWHGCLANVSAFEKPIPIADLPKIAPAFEGTNQTLRVWFNERGEVEIWGFAVGFLDYYGLRIQPLSLGELLIDIKSQDYPWVRLLLSFAETNVVQRQTPIHGLLTQFDASTTVGSDEWHRAGHRKQRVFGFMVDIVNKMSLHGHGGTMLFVPAEQAEAIMQRSIKDSIPLRPNGNYSVIRNKLNQEEREISYSRSSKKKNSSLPWSFEKEADLLGQFTSVDGATVLTKDFDVIAIGAKIREANESTSEGNVTLKIWVQQPFENCEPVERDVYDIGGTRHQSAAHFVYDNRTENAFAIVASQDGKISIIYWDDKEQKLNLFTHAEYSYRWLRYS